MPRPIGINVRSTVATLLSNVHDELRKRLCADSEGAKGYGNTRQGDFSSAQHRANLRCPVCDGTGQISLDVQFLPDVDVPCPECGGSRYGKEACRVVKSCRIRTGRRLSLPQLMAMDVHTALQACRKIMKDGAPASWTVLENLGLGYLTLGEETPSLSGGEAQRLKLASEMGKGQSDTVFIFDEPTIGLHRLRDVRTLLGSLPDPDRKWCNRDRH